MRDFFYLNKKVLAMRDLCYIAVLHSIESSLPIPGVASLGKCEFLQIWLFARREWDARAFMWYGG